MHAHEMLELYNIILFSCKAYVNKLIDALKTIIFTVNAIMHAFLCNNAWKFLWKVFHTIESDIVCVNLSFSAKMTHIYRTCK